MPTFFKMPLLPRSTFQFPRQMASLVFDDIDCVVDVFHQIVYFALEFIRIIDSAVDNSLSRVLALSRCEQRSRDGSAGKQPESAPKHLM
jgi:hypothetical protein